MIRILHYVQLKILWLGGILYYYYYNIMHTVYNNIEYLVLRIRLVRGHGLHNEYRII